MTTKMGNLSFYNDRHEQRALDVSRFESITQGKAASTVSDRYKFIPTTQALTVLGDHGWFPVAAMEARTRKEENQGFQRHAIRLVNERFNREMSVGSTVPQILLTNSHSGTAAFELIVALFEKVCSNGLVVNRGEQDRIRVLHRGYADADMSAAVESTVKLLPETLAETDRFKSTILTDDERLAYARGAIELRFDGDKYAVEPHQLLWTGRSAERVPTLWNTYNVVQEKVIKGGVRQQRRDGSRIRSREVGNIQENIKLNRALWTLTQEMAKLKAA